jgi:hypothetical protein
VIPKEQRGSSYAVELWDLKKALTPQEQVQVERILRAARRNLFSRPLTLGEAFGYSLRLFIPVVEIPSGGQWIPSPDEPLPGLRVSVETYASLHRLAGAILVPLGLAALTGLLLRRDKI